MRILFVYYTHKPGGFCKRLYRLMNALQSRGHEILYCCLDQPPEELSENIVWYRLWHPLRARQGAIFWLLLCGLLPLQLLKVIKVYKPQKLVVFNPFYAVMVWPAKVRYRIPAILFVRLSLRAASSWVERLINRLGLWAADTIVCMTEVMKQEIEDRIGSNQMRAIQVLPNDIGAITNRERTPPGGTLRCLTAGYLVSRKNVGFLLDVFALLERKYGERAPQLQIAGDGPELPVIKQRALDLDMHSVSFLGWQNNLTNSFDGTDLLLHAATHEGVSNVILEALGSGLPVLASNTPEHKEVLVYDDLLFDLRDPAALARCLGELNESSAGLDRIKELGLTCAKRYAFDWDLRASELVEGSP